MGCCSARQRCGLRSAAGRSDAGAGISAAFSPGMLGCEARLPRPRCPGRARVVLGPLQGTRSHAAAPLRWSRRQTTLARSWSGPASPWLPTPACLQVRPGAREAAPHAWLPAQRMLTFLPRHPAAAFAIFTFANLAPRGWRHHLWWVGRCAACHGRREFPLNLTLLCACCHCRYKAKFPQYPRDRYAVIPYLW